MPEVQKHGFIWERELATKVYGATEEECKANSYTAKHDIPSYLNKLDSVNVSVKTCNSKNAVCMGQPLNVLESVSSGEQFHATILRFKQVEKEKHLESLIELDLTNSKQLLFGDLIREEIEGAVELIKQIKGKRKPTPEERVEVDKLINALNLKTNTLKLNFKVGNPVRYNRLQCSFNKVNFKKFLEGNPDRIIARNEGTTFRGKTILEVIKSGKRIFNK
jgi:hypothetical protein